ncbi:adhesion G-protein coupled receptor G1-like [Labeo rohita]|uniref:adhesion G-protein coupled receptor G1-like n=1 Tax=Labeo rohita TaxID=84645 RepID=UPI0021E23924|nr:adhesion G-protein coupled receptor G1-like [Labeo rohita]
MSRMLLSLGIMSQQKQNLLWLMIICCASRQITASKKLIIQVNSTDQCFWNKSSSPYPDIKFTCLTDKEGIVKLNISSLGQCRSLSLNITKQGENYEIRMNETIQGIKLWLLRNDHCLLSEMSTSLANVGIVCNSTINPKTECQNISTVDPEVECRNAVNADKDKCSKGKEQSRYILDIKENPKCEICIGESSTTVTPLSHNTTHIPTTSSDSHRTTHKPTSSTSHTTTHNLTTSSTSHTTTHNLTTSSASHRTTHNPTITLKPHNATHSSTTVEDGYTDPSKASKALDNLESKMEEMEKSNKTNEMIVTKDAVGLIYIQAKNTETKDINICYSSNHTMVVESQTDPNTNCSWSVKISKEAFDKSRLENNGSAFVGVLQFKNIGNKDETKNQTVLNNEVYGITMRANITNLTDNIDMFFTNNDMECKASCSSWDGKGVLNWTTFGCETEINGNTIKCSCSHLTFFAVLMSLPDANETALHLESLTLITSAASPCFFCPSLYSCISCCGKPNQIRPRRS